MADQKTSGEVMIKTRTLARIGDLHVAVQMHEFLAEENVSVFLAGMQGWLSSYHPKYRITQIERGWNIWRGEELRFYLLPGEWIFWDQNQKEFYKTTRQVADRFWVEVPVALDPETKLSVDERFANIEVELSGFDYDRLIAMQQRIAELADIARERST